VTAYGPRLRRGGLIAVLAMAVAATIGCGGGGHSPEYAAPRTAPRVRPPAPKPPLAIGLSEPDADLLFTAAARPTTPDLAPWRDRLSALHPAYYRLFIDWNALQPNPVGPADLALPADGCDRGVAPCGPYDGVRDELAAARSQQLAGGGWQVVIVIYGVPDWAAAPASGCERAHAAAFSRPITAEGLLAYRALIAAVLELGRQEGVTLRWWAPWNEPDHPAFISPQRATCDPSSPLVSTAVYAQLVRAAQAELAGDPQPHGLVLGELAGFTKPSRYASTAAQFVRALPDDVACAAAVWGVHDYARPPAPAGGDDPVAAVEQALAARPCTRRAHIWVDETGAGDPYHSPPTDRVAACEILAADLARWAADPRVDAAFQYTFRDDPMFAVGLADASLTHLWPSYGAWAALAAGRVPSASDCRPAVSAG
jgi:hypothetical protein